MNMNATREKFHYKQMKRNGVIEMNVHIDISIQIENELVFSRNIATKHKKKCLNKETRWFRLVKKIEFVILYICGKSVCYTEMDCQKQT